MSNGTSFLRISLETNEDESAIRFHFLNNVKIQLNQSTVFDGEWHYVGLKFPATDNPNDHKVYLTYDRHEQAENFTYYSYQYLRDLVISPHLDIVIGSSLAIDDYGRPISTEPGHINSQFFRGCLREVYIGSYRLPFISQSKLEEANTNITNRSLIETTGPTAFYINERFDHAEQHLPRLGCILCYEKDCKNGGQCLDPTQSYDCSCAAGYEGETCDVSNATKL